ncbi:MAG: asparagine synthase C-terminal domain-containing protein, partial [Clostridiales bacterium]|nr:asparagine synthase C-terminal domain-containing protein [Clostridiales bacterium]
GNAYIFSKPEREAILKNPTGNFDPAAITRPFYEQVKHRDDITKMQYIDIHFWLIGDILLKADKMSMANSLEVRVPFLDKKVFETASKIPTYFRVNRTATKYAFRMAAKSYVPDDVSERKKLGFPVPIRIWLRDEKYYNVVKEAFTSESAKKYFNTDKLVDLLNRHKDLKADYSRKIWTVYSFLVWHKVYFEG